MQFGFRRLFSGPHCCLSPSLHFSFVFPKFLALCCFVWLYYEAWCSFFLTRSRLPQGTSFGRRAARAASDRSTSRRSQAPLSAACQRCLCTDSTDDVVRRRLALRGPQNSMPAQWPVLPRRVPVYVSGLEGPQSVSPSVSSETVLPCRSEQEIFRTLIDFVEHMCSACLLGPWRCVA